MPYTLIAQAPGEAENVIGTYPSLAMAASVMAHMEAAFTDWLDSDGMDPPAEA